MDAVVIRVVILVGEERVGDDPVIVGALRGAGGPLVEAPLADDAGGGVDLAVAEIRPAGSGVVPVGLAMSEGDDLLSGAREIRGGVGESLVDEEGVELSLLHF